VSLEIVQSLPKEEWRRFVDEHPAGNIFHTPEMFDVFSCVKGYKPQLWAAANSQGPLVLLLPVQITLFNGLLRRFTTRAISYGSVLCKAGSEGANALSVLLDAYKHETEHAVLFTELRNLSNLDTVQEILVGQGFHYEDHLNYLISLKGSPEDVFARIGRRTRKNIRHALNLGKVSIEVVHEKHEMAECYGLLSQVYRNAHVPLADPSLFEALFRVLHPKGMIRITLARVDQVPAAVSVVLVFKRIIYAWYGGTDRKYGAYVPKELVIWDVLRWGAENGYDTYDFGGAGKPDEKYGVRDFKAKFNGRLVNFGRNVRTHVPLFLSLSKLGYGIYRRFIQGQQGYPGRAESGFPGSNFGK
jgi:serine/alanine adding enzyme